MIFRLRIFVNLHNVMNYISSGDYLFTHFNSKTFVWSCSCLMRPPTADVSNPRSRRFNNFKREEGPRARRVYFHNIDSERENKRKFGFDRIEFTLRAAILSSAARRWYIIFKTSPSKQKQMCTVIGLKSLMYR